MQKPLEGCFYTEPLKRPWETHGQIEQLTPQQFLAPKDSFTCCVRLFYHTNCKNQEKFS